MQRGNYAMEGMLAGARAEENNRDKENHEKRPGFMLADSACFSLLLRSWRTTLRPSSTLGSRRNCAAPCRKWVINPHSWIHIDVKNADGTTTRWMIEGGTPNTLLGAVSQGFPSDWHRDSRRRLPAKDGSNRANGRDLTYPDGKKIFLGSSGPEVRRPTPRSRNVC
jgi:hypothetical protein